MGRAKKFGKDNDLKEKTNYRYLQSEKEADYIPNLKKFSKDKYDLSFGIGYKLEGAIKVAKESPKQQFAIVDTVVDAPNVTSITFKDHEGSFLVGAVATMSTKSE